MLDLVKVLKLGVQGEFPQLQHFVLKCRSFGYGLFHINNAVDDWTSFREDCDLLDASSLVIL